MLSDWHIGTGAGRPGNVDRLVARDHEGFPFVPAKTLTGIWRDGAERAALALDEGNEGDWSKFVQVIFGSEPSLLGKVDGAEIEAPVPSRISISPARFSEAVRSLLVDERSRESLTFVKASNSIDSQTGAARKDHLRFEEMARMDAVLHAECELDFEDADLLDCARHLLIASAKLVERLGGKRRRGAGKCKLMVVGEDEKTAIERAATYFRNNPSPPNWKLLEGGLTTPDYFSSPESGEWVRVPLTLELITPLSIVVRAVGNVAESLDFVPGTYLLPRVTRVLEDAASEAKDVACRKKIRSLVSCGDIQVLHAYPRVKNERGLPVPGFLYKKKEADTSDGKEEVSNRAVRKVDANTQLKDFRNGFISFRKSEGIGTVFLQERLTSLFIHNTIQNERQRPMEEEGGVYSREAMAAGTILETELRLRKSLFSKLPKNWEQKLSGECRIGVSKKDDYGKVRITIGGKQPEELEPETDRTTVTVWLLSDLLIRDASLRPTADPSALTQELQQRLKLCSLSIRQKGELVSMRAFVRRLDSWNTQWGLPRPTLVGMQAGSCFVLESNEPIDLDELKQIQREGIGERRAEGYGQIALNHPMLSLGTLTLETVSGGTPRSASSSPGVIVNQENDFLKVIELAAWRVWLANTVLIATDTAKKRKESFGFDVSGNKPPMSQLGGLRQTLQRMRNRNEAVDVTKWIDKVLENPLRSKRWPKGSLEEKIRPLFKNPILVWNRLDVDTAPPLLQRTLEEMKNMLWAEAVRGFFDAAIRAHKRDLEMR